VILTSTPATLLGYAGRSVLTACVDAVKGSHYKLQVFLRNRSSHTAHLDLAPGSEERDALGRFLNKMK
jgi:hypothetical protein